LVYLFSCWVSWFCLALFLKQNIQSRPQSKPQSKSKPEHTDSLTEVQREILFSGFGCVPAVRNRCDA
jgi:hypothetical protein